MLRARCSLRLGVVLWAFLELGCRREPEHPREPLAATSVSMPLVTTPSIPLEGPLETVRVPNSGLPCAVDDLLAAKCRRCYTIPARHAAPFALLTWDDTRGLVGDRPRYQVMASATKSGYMPYNIEANPPVERLTDEEKKVIADWVAAGAPKAPCPPTPALAGSLSPRAARVHALASALPQPGNVPQIVLDRGP